jgi:hypothetical protein
VRTQLIWNGPATSQAAKAAAAQGLFLAAQHVKEESSRLVPIEEGTLQRSATVSVDEGELVAAVSYDTPYAARQHEELTWRHARGRQAKYLEQPLNGTRAQQTQIIARELKRSLGGK